MRKYLAALMIGAFVFTGCTSVDKSEELYGSGSRSVLYDSIQQLRSDASIIVTGEVGDQKVIEPEGRITFTLSTVTVQSVIDVDKPRYPPVADVNIGDQIVVRQLGDTRDQNLPAPLFTKGSSYLLFLNSSGLPGSEASQFYVTGGTAGYYAATDETSPASDVLFRKVGDEGDTLPKLLTLSDLGD